MHFLQLLIVYTVTVIIEICRPTAAFSIGTHPQPQSHIKVSLAIHQHQDDIQSLEQVILQKLQRITTGYETHINNMIQSLEVELELCIKTENCLLRGISSDDNMRHDGNRSLLLSEKYRSKSSIMKQCFDSNYQVVQQLLLVPSSTKSSQNMKLYSRLTSG